MKYLYLFKQVDTNNYKIGVSKHPDKRIKQLNTANPIPIELVFLLQTKVPFKLESSLHDFFSNKRYEGNEWFLFDNDDIDLFQIKAIEMNDRLAYLKDNNSFCKGFK